MTEQELQIALTKMLPERLKWNKRSKVAVWVYPQRHVPDGNSYTVLDTEWLHVCWLAEQSLNADERMKVAEHLRRNRLCDQERIQPYYEVIGLIACSDWQQRAEALCRVKGITL